MITNANGTDRFSDEQIEAAMEWPRGAMKNVELFDMTYRVRKLADAAFLAGARAASEIKEELRALKIYAPPSVPNDPECTCGSDSKRAYNHAITCPHSTPWNERVKKRLAVAARLRHSTERGIE
jgi:hypothetical protein